MNLHLVLQILYGIVVGWLAGIVVQGRGLGLLPNLIFGVLGAILGNAFVKYFHIPVPEVWWGTLGVSVGGAVVLLIVLRLILRD
jgi:uncharacterized membrane protein YeaQ/YmgE (transglycosylase-associated protein family)